MNQLLDEITDPRLMIGGNKPPLAERLAEEIKPLVARMDELVGVASKAAIIDDASCAKVVDLIGLCRAHLVDVKRAHETEASPFRAALDTVTQFYRPVEVELETVIGKTARDGLRGMITAHEAKRQAETEAERRRLAEEQRQREAEAEEARRKLEAKRATGAAGVNDELAVLQAEDAAARLGQRAEAIRPVPIRANLGNVGTTRQIAFEITDLRKALGWLIKSPLRPSVEEMVRQIMGRYLRNLGVNQVEKGVAVPGIETRIDRVAAVR